MLCPAAAIMLCPAAAIPYNAQTAILRFVNLKNELHP